MRGHRDQTPLSERNQPQHSWAQVINHLQPRKETLKCDPINCRIPLKLIAICFNG